MLPGLPPGERARMWASRRGCAWPRRRAGAAGCAAPREGGASGAGRAG